MKNKTLTRSPLSDKMVNTLPVKYWHHENFFLVKFILDRYFLQLLSSSLKEKGGGYRNIVAKKLEDDIFLRLVPYIQWSCMTVLLLLGRHRWQSGQITKQKWRITLRFSNVAPTTVKSAKYHIFAIAKVHFVAVLSFHFFQKLLFLKMLFFIICGFFKQRLSTYRYCNFRSRIRWKLA